MMWLLLVLPAIGILALVLWRSRDDFPAQRRWSSAHDVLSTWTSAGQGSARAWCAVVPAPAKPARAARAARAANPARPRVRKT